MSLQVVVNLILYPIKAILPIETIKNLAYFIFKKTLLYSFFTTLSLFILLTYYLKYIPKMDQRVTIQYHLINGHYYGFVYDDQFKNICTIQGSDDLKFNFQTSLLIFPKNILCSVILEEIDNLVTFQDEYYQIWYQINAQVMTPQHNNIIEINSYQIGEDLQSNFKQSNIIKLGEQYYFKVFKYFPFRVIIKIFTKFIELLDLNDTYSKSGEILLFTHMPNQKANLQAMILEIKTQYPMEMESELLFTPILNGLRYYFYFYFWTTLIFGTYSLTLLIIFFWEIVLNINLWIFIIRTLREIIQAFQ